MAENKSSSEASVERQQLKTLVDAIKKIVTCPRAPEWIKNQLESAVKSAKALGRDVSSEPCRDTREEAKNAVQPAENAKEEKIRDIGVLCRDAADPKDECVYEITRRGLVIEGVQLWDVRVKSGDDRTPPGVTMHNVPSHLLSPL